MKQRLKEYAKEIVACTYLPHTLPSRSCMLGFFFNSSSSRRLLLPFKSLTGSLVQKEPSFNL